MLAYAVRRLLQAVPTVFGVLLLTFVLFRLLPTDIAEKLAGEGASAQTIADLRWAFGLDKPLFFDLDGASREGIAKLFDSQFFDHFQRMLTFDFGRSWSTRRDVWGSLLDGIGPSLALTVPIFFLTLTTAIGLSLFTASRRGSRIDSSLVIACVIGMNVPLLSFIIIGQYVFAWRLGWFPVHGFHGPGSVILPVLIGVTAGLGGEVRFYRTVMLEEMHQDYVRTARAKGLSGARVLLAHVLPNALLPVATRVVLALPFLVFGSLLLERFFGIPGAGHLMVEAVTARDYAVVNAMTWLIALLFVFGNLLTDLCYAWLDPRVTLK
ncbi:MAG: ABC transporter permease [Myxococcales bacterium]|nr:ABC transporter permease [Myxococcales bacterium]